MPTATVMGVLRPLGKDLSFKAYLRATCDWWQDKKRVSLVVIGLVLGAVRLVLGLGIVEGLTWWVVAVGSSLLLGFWFFRRHDGDLAVNHPLWPFKGVRRR